mgnify:FL=1
MDKLEEMVPGNTQFGAIGVVPTQSIVVVAAMTLYLYAISKWVFPPIIRGGPIPPVYEGNRLLKVYVTVAGFVGLYIPIAYIVWCACSHTAGEELVSHLEPMISHTFLLGAQVVAERVSFSCSFSLPARALVPIFYNTLRLYDIWAWLHSPHHTSFSLSLALSNLILWSFNLFCFLIPIYLPTCLHIYYSQAFKNTHHS